MTAAIAILTALASISASIAAIFTVINHSKVSQVKEIVNGRLAETLDMLRKSAEQLAASELKRHEETDKRDNQV